VLWAGLAGLALAGTVLSKLYPLMLVPVCAAWLAGGERPWRDLAVFVAVSAAVIVLAYLPFLGIGVAQVTEGLRTYAREWQRNDGVFMLLAQGPRPRAVAAGIVAGLALFAAARLYLSSTSDGLGSRPLRFARNDGSRNSHPIEPDRGAGVSGAPTSSRHCERPTRARGDPLSTGDALSADALVLAFQTALLGWFLFTPAAYPWYAIGLLAVSTLRPRLWAVVLSGAFGLYYLLFLFEYREYPPYWATYTQALEHGLVWLAVVVPLRAAKTVRTKIEDPALR
jgi:hypothetical protein